MLDTSAGYELTASTTTIIVILYNELGCSGSTLLEEIIHINNIGNLQGKWSEGRRSCDKLD